MTISNLTIHEDIAFSDYLKIPGHSYSSIKHDGKEFAPSQKMITGTMVHQYLLEPHKFNGDIKLVKPIATALIKALGPIYKHLQYEVSISCEMQHEGMKMRYKGRIDGGIHGKLVIDFKIAENIHASKSFFGYDDQLSGYALAFNAPLALIIACNPKQRYHEAQVIPVTINDNFWKTQILLKGEL